MRPLPWSCDSVVIQAISSDLKSLLLGSLLFASTWRWLSLEVSSKASTALSRNRHPIGF
jgi:hypothetical protein